MTFLDAELEEGPFEGGEVDAFTISFSIFSSFGGDGGKGSSVGDGGMFSSSMGGGDDTIVDVSAAVFWTCRIASRTISSALSKSSTSPGSSSSSEMILVVDDCREKVTCYGFRWIDRVLCWFI